MQVQQFLNGAEPHGHIVQFYKADEALLNRNVASFLCDGLLVIASPSRLESLTSHLNRLGADVSLARREGQLAMMDADEMLGRILVEGQPDWERFQVAIGEALQLANARTPDGGVSAYGEMVGLLWEAGQTNAALRLEEHWNRLLHRGGIHLFCGYPIDVFADAFHGDRVHEVLSAHTHLMASGPNGDLGEALDRAMEELLGSRAAEVRSSMNAGFPALSLAVPKPENAILWLRRNIPEEAEQILGRARGYFEASRAAAS
jgi:hypothetical protein